MKATKGQPKFLLYGFLRLLIVAFIVWCMLGCFSAAEGRKKTCGPWGCEESIVDYCEARCTVWDEQRKVCLKFHAHTSERCAEIFKENVDRLP